MASPYEDAEARPHLDAGRGLHDEDAEALTHLHVRRGLHDAPDHEDLQVSQHRDAEARPHFLEASAKFVAYCGFCEPSTGRNMRPWIKTV